MNPRAHDIKNALDSVFLTDFDSILVAREWMNRQVAECLKAHGWTEEIGLRWRHPDIPERCTTLQALAWMETNRLIPVDPDATEHDREAPQCPHCGGTDFAVVEFDHITWRAKWLPDSKTIRVFSDETSYEGDTCNTRLVCEKVGCGKEYPLPHGVEFDWR